MPLFKKRPRTAQQKAQRAQMRIFARLACCAYMVYYVIIPLIRDNPADDSGASGMSPTLRIAIITAFSVITAVLLVLSILEVVKGVKAGEYKATSYSDDEGLFVAESAGGGSGENSESDDDVDDYGDDEDYEYDDDEEDE